MTSPPPTNTGQAARARPMGSGPRQHLHLQLTSLHGEPRAQRLISTPWSPECGGPPVRSVARAREGAVLGQGGSSPRQGAQRKVLSSLAPVPAPRESPQQEGSSRQIPGPVKVPPHHHTGHTDRHLSRLVKPASGAWGEGTRLWRGAPPSPSLPTAAPRPAPAPVPLPAPVRRHRPVTVKPGHG